MTRAFTIYWTPEGWEKLPEGEPITTAAGTGFSTRVSAGDRVYVTNVKDGQLRLLGAFTVHRVVLAQESGKPPGAVWEAPEYLLAREGSSRGLRARAIPLSLVHELRFVSKGPEEGSVSLNPDGSVNGQAMRSVRELTPSSASALESLFEPATEAEWTDDELQASVEAYLDMAKRIHDGQPVVKKQYYRDLSARFARTEKSFEYRMQNISYVLSLLGRDWISGLPPAKNVGANVAARIEHFLGLADGVLLPSRAAEKLNVAKARKEQRTRPRGSKTPARTSSTVTSYVRDPEVKAWVLERAHGKCEACSTAAPFQGTDGFPFLEVHHVRHLADGGSDTASNAVAVCPNCHRRLHYSTDAREHGEVLFSAVAELVRE